MEIENKTEEEVTLDLSESITNTKSSLEIIENYCTKYPANQNAVDIFKGDWASFLPGDTGALSDGFAPLFNDERISWMVEKLGGVDGKRILELGPLEGGHTYMLEAEHNAKQIISIEANERAYLKCLVAKEILGTTSSRFLLGDFNEYMATSNEFFDVVVACGVLYHMQNPAEHIKRLCSSADTVFVWTHYYDKELIEAIGDEVAKKFNHESPTSFEGYDYVLYQQDYLDALGWSGFCGAGSQSANWIKLDDIYNMFDKYDFEITDTNFHEKNHIHGPAIAFIAKRKHLA